MTSKERVRRAMRCQPVDRVPAAFEAVSAVSRRLCGQYHCNYGDLLDRYRIDILPTGPAYIGPKLRQFHNAKGQLVQQSWWGYMSTRITTSIDEYDTTTESARAPGNHGGSKRLFVPGPGLVRLFAGCPSLRAIPGSRDSHRT